MDLKQQFSMTAELLAIIGMRVLKLQRYLRSYRSVRFFVKFL